MMAFINNKMLISLLLKIRIYDDKDERDLLLIL